MEAIYKNRSYKTIRSHRVNLVLVHPSGGRFANRKYTSLPDFEGSGMALCGVIRIGWSLETWLKFNK